jgi:DtxR family Mn-dependent transcriptional regulator
VAPARLDDGLRQGGLLVTDLIDTTEMYLRTILDLEEENIVPLRARISERLGHSGPTVSQTIARMERDGLVVVSGDRHLELTPSGRSKAVHVMRKHRLAERLLADVIGLEWEYVHDEACRWEHVMSEQVERRLIELPRPAARVPVRQPDPGDSRSSGSRRPMHSCPGSSACSTPSPRATSPFAASSAAWVSPCSSIPCCSASSSTRVSCRAPGLVQQRRAYILVEVDGVDGGLELPSEVAGHIFVGNNP